MLLPGGASGNAVPAPGAERHVAVSPVFFDLARGRLAWIRKYACQLCFSFDVLWVFVDVLCELLVSLACRLTHCLAHRRPLRRPDHVLLDARRDAGREGARPAE